MFYMCLFLLMSPPLDCRYLSCAQVPQSVIDAVNTEVGNVRSVLESGSAEDIKSKVSDLQKALMKIGESLAQSSQGDSGSSAGSGEGASASGTYDADVKDEKK